MGDEVWKVGEVAEKTGVSVRTLHYYDEIGLLRPSERTGSGHRLYGFDDLARLQQIMSLRQLGFSLEEIADVLDRGVHSPVRVIDMHIRRLQEQIEAGRELRDRLQEIRDKLASRDVVSADDLLRTIKEIEMNQTFEKYYSKEELEYLEQRKAVVGEDRIREVEGEWRDLIAAVKQSMENGTDPTDPRVLELARKWQALIEEFTGGHVGVRRSLGNLYQHEPKAMEKTGLNSEIMAYVAKATAALGG